MLKTLYDEEYLLELHINSRIRENTEKVTKEVTEKVTKEVTEKVTKDIAETVTREVTDKHIRSTEKVFRGMGMSSEEITAKLMEMYEIDRKQAAEYVN